MQQENNIIANFFYYLEKNNITQKDYEIKNDLPLTTLSKWKKGISQPSIDQIKQAADFFNITVNDLVYSKEEKKHIEVLKDSTYSPIMAQQVVKIKKYNNAFKKPLIILLFVWITTIISLLLGILFFEISIYTSLIFILITPLSFIVMNKSFYEEKSYIINYLDDIYYEINDTKNTYYKKHITLTVANLFILLISIFNMLNISNLHDSITLPSIYLINIMSLLIISLNQLYAFKPNLHKRLSKDSIKNFILVFLGLTISVVNILFNLYLIIVFNDFIILNTITTTILLITNYLNFSYVCKNKAKYELIYKESNISKRKLD